MGNSVRVPRTVGELGKAVGGDIAERGPDDRPLVRERHQSPVRLRIERPPGDGDEGEVASERLDIAGAAVGAGRGEVRDRARDRIGERSTPGAGEGARLPLVLGVIDGDERGADAGDARQRRGEHPVVVSRVGRPLVGVETIEAAPDLPVVDDGPEHLGARRRAGPSPEQAPVAGAGEALDASEQITLRRPADDDRRDFLLEVPEAQRRRCREDAGRLDHRHPVVRWGTLRRGRRQGDGADHREGVPVASARRRPSRPPHHCRRCRDCHGTPFSPLLARLAVTAGRRAIIPNALRRTTARSNTIMPEPRRPPCDLHQRFDSVASFLTLAVAIIGCHGHRDQLDPRPAHPPHRRRRHRGL